MKPSNLHKLYRVCVALFAAVCFGVCPCASGSNQFDFTQDGVVDLLDFAILSESWALTLPWGPDGLPPQMISHWPLDIDAADSQSSYDGVIYGNPVWVTKPLARVGQGAIYMDGDDYIAIDANDYPALTGSFTIDARIRISSNDRDQILISKGQSSWQIGVDGQSKKAFISCEGLSGNSYLAGSTALADETWYHLAGVYDQGEQKLRLYLDGSLDTDANAMGTVNLNAEDIWIGGDPEQPQQGPWWNGYIDNVRLYNYALSTSEIFQRRILHVDTKQGSDSNNGQGRQSAYKTIQRAIDMADNGDVVRVWPGIYYESIGFLGKAITVKSAADAATISSPEDYAVSFYFGEQVDSVLENFVIRGSEVGISVSGSSPALRYLTVVNNDYAIDLWGTSRPQIENCILWDNVYDDVYTEAFSPDVTYSCVERAVGGQGNISADPVFADPNNDDYHLQSQLGRYLPAQDGGGSQSGAWVTDQNNSPCIDAGRPTINPMCEPISNGGRVNMGACGSTHFASKSPWPFKADVNFNGQILTEHVHVFI